MALYSTHSRCKTIPMNGAVQTMREKEYENMQIDTQIRQTPECWVFSMSEVLGTVA